VGQAAVTYDEGSWTRQSCFFSAPISLPKVTLEFCERARKWIQDFLGFFLVQGFQIFFPLVYISELSNKWLVGMYLHIIVMNATERSRTF